MRVPLSQPLHHAIESSRQQLGVSATAWLFSCFAVLLSRWGGEREISVGTVLANRLSAQIHGVVGMFANLAVLSLEVDDEIDFARLCLRARDLLLAVDEHSELPFEMLVERSARERNPQFAPLFQIAFDVRDPRLRDSGHADIDLALMGCDVGRVQYDLHLTIEPGQDALVAIWSYNTDLFEPRTIERLAAAYTTLAAAAAAAPTTHVTRLPLLTSAERTHLLRDFNTSERAVASASAHQQFVQQAGVRPDAIALRYAGREVSYAALERQTASVAAALAAHGVRPGDLVAVAVERSCELVAALLGVLRAGAAFVPIDATSPPERVAYMLSDSACGMALVSAATRELVGTTPALEITAACQAEPRASVPAVAPEDLAYLIYTSGSTGTPKGVLLEHRGLSNLVGAEIAALEITPESRVLQFSSVSFDAAVWEIFATLAAGACLVLGSREELLPGRPLVDFMRAERITLATLVPSVLRVLPATPLPDLKTLVSAGEPLSADLVQRWAPGRTMINAYGPTETTVCATLAAVSAEHGAPPDIGGPIANCRVYLLDPRLEPVPVGVDGEICVGGPGVARGYHARADLSAERFCRDPFVADPAARLFRTGDYGRWREDGSIEFLGRRDDQFKIRGVRVEIGEIEAALGGLPGITAAVVAPDPRTGGADLIAFVAATDAPRATADALRAALAPLLPAAMIPAHFQFVDAIPYATSGKADRRALLARLPELPAMPAMPAVMRGSGVVGGDLENLIAAIWCAVLEREEVDHEANFFDIGGHSLHAAMINAELQEKLQREIPLIDHFRFQTVAALARHLRGEPELDAVDQADAAAQRSQRLQQGRSQLATLRARRQASKDER